MTLMSKGGPRGPTHQEILEKEWARMNHVVDILHICHNIVVFERDVVVRGEFQEGTH